MSKDLHHARFLTTLLPLGWALGCSGDAPVEPAPVAAPPAAPATAPIDENTWYGTHQAPCGRSLLSVSHSPDGPFTLVDPSGAQDPTAVLGYQALVNGRFILQGRLTGQVLDDEHCGAVPELEVTGFQPWGPVQRVFSAESLETALQHYTEDRPTDRYVPEDYASGSGGRLLDGSSCQELDPATCAAPRVMQRDADGRTLCCSFVATGAP